MNGVSAPTDGRQRAAADVFGMFRTGPTGALARAAAVAVGALLVAWLHSARDPGVLCLLRRLTGIPCPMCGSTTVFIELGSGSLRGAVLANPVTFLGMVGLIVAPLGPGRWWWRSSARLRNVLLGCALTASWVYQLARFDLLPH